MSRHSTAVATFRSAMSRSDVEAAMTAAGEMERVGLYDALDLCRLLAEAGDSRFESAALRWIRYFQAEGASLSELQLAIAGLSVLVSEPESQRAWNTLTGLVRSDLEPAPNA